MTNAEQTLGYETVKHLDAWLARNVRDEDQGRWWSGVSGLREAMLRLAANDEDYWLAQGWWRVHDQVNDR